MLKKILQPIYAAYVTATFLISVLTAFPVFLFISLWNNHSSRRMLCTIVMHWSRVWLWLIGMPVTFSGAKLREDRYVIVANHISYLDTIVIFSAVPGYFRPLGKKEIARMPVLGFIYSQLAILVDRNSPHSRARSVRLLWRVLHHEGHVLLFPEGTFNETGNVLKPFYDGAFKLAINTQVNIWPIVFPDTVHRWHYSAWWKLWPGRNRVIYLQPIAVTGRGLKDVHALKEDVFAAMKKALTENLTESKFSG